MVWGVLWPAAVLTGVTSPVTPGSTVDGKGTAVDESGDLADKRLKEACQQLEAVFWHLLLRAMRKTIPEGGLFEQSLEEKLYLDMLDEQYAILLAQQDTAGIGRILYEQLRQKGEK